MLPRQAQNWAQEILPQLPGLHECAFEPYTLQTVLVPQVGIDGSDDG